MLPRYGITDYDLAQPSDSRVNIPPRYFSIMPIPDHLLTRPGKKFKVLSGFINTDQTEVPSISFSLGCLTGFIPRAV